MILNDENVMWLLQCEERKENIFYVQTTGFSPGFDERRGSHTNVENGYRDTIIRLHYINIMHPSLNFISCTVLVWITVLWYSTYSTLAQYVQYFGTVRTVLWYLMYSTVLCSWYYTFNTVCSTLPLGFYITWHQYSIYETLGATHSVHNKTLPRRGLTGLFWRAILWQPIRILRGHAPLHWSYCQSQSRYDASCLFSIFLKIGQRD